MLKKIFGIFISTLLITLSMTGCAKSDSDEKNTGNLQLESITISSDQPELVVGLTTDLTAIGVYSDGTDAVITDAVTWSSDDTDVVTVTGNVATGTGTGTTNITATLSGVTGTLEIKVTQAQLTALRIVEDDNSASATNEFIVGETIKAKALADFNNGMHNIDVTTKVAWAAGNQGTVSVDQNGLITALSAGDAEVSASYQGEFGQASDTITGTVVAKTVTKVQIFSDPDNSTVPAGESIKLEAWATYNDGSNHNVTDTVKWASNNPQVTYTLEKYEKTLYVTSNESDVNATITATSKNGVTVGSRVVVFESKVPDHIEIQDGYCGDGDCPVITGKTIDIPIVDDVNYDPVSQGAYYPTAWLVFSDGSKEYITDRLGIRWWSADQIRAYVNTVKGSFVFGRGLGEGIEISVSYRGEHKTSFFVNVIQDTTTKTLQKVGIMNTQEYGWGCSQIDEDYGEKLTMLIGDEGKYLMACGQFKYTDGTIKWEDINNNVAWLSSDSDVARVQTYSGELKALGAGNAVISAQLAGIKGLIDVTVEDKTISHIEIQESWCEDGTCPVITGTTVDIPIVDDVTYNPTPIGTYYPTAWLVFTDGTKQYINTTSGIRWWSADQIRAYVNTTKGSFVFGRGLGNGIEISVSYRGENKTSFFVNVKEDTTTKTLKSVGIKNTKDLGWGCTQDDADYGTALTVKLSILPRSYLQACGKFEYSDGSPSKWEDINNNVAWFTTDRKIAYVRTTTGKLKTVKPGTVTIKAQVAGVDGSIGVTVNQ